MPHFEHAATIAQNRIGPDHPDTLTARANLAVSYWSAGRTNDAIDILERVVATSEESLGADHPDTLTAQRTLGMWRDEQP